MYDNRWFCHFKQPSNIFHKFACSKRPEKLCQASKNKYLLSVA